MSTGRQGQSSEVQLNISFEGITRNFRDIKDFIVFTVEPPWSACASLFPNAPKQVFFAKELEKKALMEFLDTAPQTEFVVGIGGGVATDTAKYVALQRRAKFVAIPTAVSVNAYATARAAVRTEGIVKYIGDKFADLIVIDYDVIRSAPQRLNRAGVGDIYAIRTALLDWRLAARTKGDEFSQKVADEAEEVIRQLRASADDIRAVTNAGIGRIVASHARESSLQRGYTLWRESEGMKNVVIHGLWPAEGSEHSFFYALEKLTGRHFIHGEAVGTGSVISFYLHNGDVDTVIRDLDSFGLQFRPSQYGVSFEEFESAINSMMDVTLAMRIDYPIFRQRDLAREEIKEIWRILS